MRYDRKHAYQTCLDEMPKGHHIHKEKFVRANGYLTCDVVGLLRMSMEGQWRPERDPRGASLGSMVILKCHSAVHVIPYVRHLASPGLSSKNTVNR
jgi:hypothetical protein